MIEKYVLKSEASQHAHLKGTWAVGTAYEVGDIVWNDGVAFEVQSAHTAGAGDEPILDVVQGAQGETGATGATGAAGLQGPQGDPGGDANHWAIQEVPSGTQNGVNKSFTMAQIPTGVVSVFYQGVMQKNTIDYSYVGTALTLITFAPNAANGDWLCVTYPYA